MKEGGEWDSQSVGAREIRHTTGKNIFHMYFKH